MSHHLEAETVIVIASVYPYRRGEQVAVSVTRAPEIETV